MGEVSRRDRELLKRAYAAFNARDVEGALATLHREVDWPNGWEGGRVHGHEAVRDYWTRQWSEIDPHVEPTAFRTEDCGRIVAVVHQVVRDHAGNVLADEKVEHVYLVLDGSIRSMEIRKAEPAAEVRREPELRIGVVILPELPWIAARDVWRRAEELGCDHAWTYDHLAWRSLRDSPWFGAVPTLTAAATATERMRIGVLVASPNFRHPVPFARDLLALDDVSAGRLDVGIGAGGYGWDATMLGAAPPTERERADRFAEFVELLDLLLREREVSYRGTYYTANEARTHPGCAQQPRVAFAIAATKPRGMRLAATHGQTWVTTGDRTVESPLPAREGARVVRVQMDRLDQICTSLGRDPASLRRLVVTGPSLDGGLTSIEQFQETTGRYAEAGVTDLVVHWPRREPPFAADLETFERILTSLPR